VRISFSMAFVLLTALPSLSFGDDCKFRADRAGSADTAGIQKVVIRAGAGDLKVTGRSAASRVETDGIACAAKQELLDATQVNVRREGNILYVETHMPDEQSNRSWSRGYAYIDLRITLPDDVVVEAVDSAGDASFEQLKSLDLTDSSGDLSLRNIAGPLNLT
jgi:hypothetical protein